MASMKGALSFAAEASSETAGNFLSKFGVVSRGKLQDKTTRYETKQSCTADVMS